MGWIKRTMMGLTGKVLLALVIGLAVGAGLRVLWSYLSTGVGMTHGDVVQAFMPALGGLVLIAGILVANRRAAAVEQQVDATREQLDVTVKLHDENLEATREGQVNERFARAIEQLGSDQEQTRIGAIYTLEQIAAKHAEVYHQTVMEVLTAFVRGHAPLPDGWPISLADGEQFPQTDDEFRNLAMKAKKDLKPAQDVQTVLTVLGRRNRAYEIHQLNETGKQLRLDLSHTCLIGANLRQAHLEYALLEETHLEHSDLCQAHLENANLIRAHLQHAEMIQVFLERALLTEAHLEHVHATSADFNSADLLNAHLEHSFLLNARFDDSWLGHAHFDDADLMGAHLEKTKTITWEQLDSAKSFTGARLPPHLVRTARMYTKAKSGMANLEGVPVPEGYVDEMAELRSAMVQLPSDKEPNGDVESDGGDPEPPKAAPEAE